MYGVAGLPCGLMTFNVLQHSKYLNCIDRMLNHNHVCTFRLKNNNNTIIVLWHKTSTSSCNTMSGFFFKKYTYIVDCTEN